MVRNTKKRIAVTGKKVFGMLALLFIFSLFSDSIVQAKGSEVKATLPVIQKFDIENAAADSVNTEGRYELKAEEGEHPMPEGSTEGRYVFTLKNSEQTELVFLYTEAGIYRYSLKQITADAGQYVYDRSVYTITVYIKKEAAGQLVPQIIVENKAGGKCEEILFENSYTAKITPTDTPGGQPGKNPPRQTVTPKTGDETNIMLYAALLAAAFAAVSLIALFKSFGSNRNN